MPKSLASGITAIRDIIYIVVTLVTVISSIIFGYHSLHAKIEVTEREVAQIAKRLDSIENRTIQIEKDIIILKTIRSNENAKR